MQSPSEDSLSSDYARIESAIEYLCVRRAEQPSLSELARELNLSEFHLQRLFSRWAGVSPKRFLQWMTLEHAKEMLTDSADVLSTSHQTGLSGPSRLHDLFVQLEAVTPGEYQSGGKGIEIRYGFHETPFGECLIGLTDRGVCYLGFLAEQSRGELLEDLRRRWPKATHAEGLLETAQVIGQIFQPNAASRPSLSLLVRGTNFQVQVWRALLEIPEGKVSTYAAVARWIGKSGASRAVGTAIGANPVAWLIPCHRVLRSDGHLGGYHWGIARKQACLIWESEKTAKF